MDYTSQDRYPATRAEFDQQVSFKGIFDPAMANVLIPRGEVRTPRLDPSLLVALHAVWSHFPCDCGLPDSSPRLLNSSHSSSRFLGPGRCASAGPT